MNQEYLAQAVIQLRDLSKSLRNEKHASDVMNDLQEDGIIDNTVVQEYLPKLANLAPEATNVATDMIKTLTNNKSASFGKPVEHPSSVPTEPGSRYVEHDSEFMSMDF